MNKIKDLRLYKNLTVEGLAYQIGVPAEKIVKWENGEERPTDPEYLLGLEESMNGNADYIENAKPFARPIMCPHCGSRSLAFVHDYHRAIFLRVIAYIFLFAIFIALLTHVPNILYLTLIDFSKSSSADVEESIIAIVIPFIFYYLIKLAIYGIESRTHVKSICRDCGHIWLLD